MKKRKCKQCMEYAPLNECTLTNVGAFCCIDHAIKYAQEKSEKCRTKAYAKAKKDQNRKHSERKKALKTTSDHIKEAQASVNKYIRTRDNGRACISCGSSPANKYGGTMEAGHYRSRGAASHLRFNTYNINLQCVKCNRFKSGNAVDYRLALIRRIGVDKVERLENDNAPRKFTPEYLIRLKAIFNKRARHLSKIRRN